MQWLKRSLRNWVNSSELKSAIAEDSPRRRDYDDIVTSETIRFNLTPAVGGRILRVNREGNNQKGLTLGPSESTQVYVIPSGEDVGERVAKIINLELLK